MALLDNVTLLNYGPGGAGPHCHYRPQQGAGARGGRGRGPGHDVHKSRGLRGRHHHRQGRKVRTALDWQQLPALFDGGQCDHSVSPSPQGWGLVTRALQLFL